MAPSQIVSKKKPSVNFAMDIIKEFQPIETQYWSKMKMGANCPIVSYVSVHKQSREWSQLCALLNKNSRRGWNFKINDILRIQNPYLMASYLLAKEMLAEDCVVEMRQLLHGTKAARVDGIAYENFDLNAVTRERYGHGIHFTDDFMFASKFSDRTPQKVVIIANVISGMICKGYEGMIVPDYGYDTSENITKNRQNVVVKYDDDTFYPAYIVEFRSISYPK